MRAMFATADPVFQFSSKHAIKYLLTCEFRKIFERFRAFNSLNVENRNT